MNDVENALKKLKSGIETLTKSNGQREAFEGIGSSVDSISQKLEKLRNTTITPSNFNKFQADLQEINNLIKTTKENLEKIPKVDFSTKIAEQQAKIAELQAGKAERPEEAKKIDQQIRGHELAIRNYERQQEKANATVKDATDVLNLQAKATDQLDKESEEYVSTLDELNRKNTADTIRNQVNQYIGLAAIYRYTKKYIQDLVQTYKEFDQSLVAIAAVTGQTRDQMWANIGVYNQMAQSLGTTTQEVINASKLYYQQGLTTTSVLKLTEETVKLATIAELDSADATEYLTTAMNGFKLSAEESTRVTDVWANLAAKTASDVDELAVAISKVASLAENAGMEIETASAFLNQMIETTREAPENLGTALKTIIARFQELKSSEEELSDGVDANKVERALKSAGVALRDASGQFRDFDDVILELSSKWDGLDRNTQRYIATIAAGSRQQSRFIALVSDYEGLLRNVNYAYDSLGSADAQMAVFQEGLAASTNRLQAAWEGLYTSWSESATVISGLIDTMADFVSTLADLGAGTSAVIAGFVLLSGTILAKAAATAIDTTATVANNTAVIANAGSTAIAAAATESEKKALKDATEELIKHTAASALNTKQNIANAASQALILGKYLAIAAAIGLAIYALVRLATAEKRHIKQLQQQVTETKQLAAQEKDRASNLEVLANELERVHKSGEDEAEVRQKIIDQFGDEINGVNVLTGSYRDLIAALEEEQKVRNKKAAADYISSWSDEAELNKEQAKQKAREDVYNEQETVIEDGIEVGIKFNNVVYKYDGNGYYAEDGSNLNAALEEEVKARQNLIEEEFKKGFQGSKSERNFVAQQIVGDLGIDNVELEKNVTDIVSAIINTNNTVVDSKTGEIHSVGSLLFEDLQKNFSPEQISNIAAILNGNLDSLSLGLIQGIEFVFGKDSAIAQKFNTIWETLNASINQGWEESGLSASVQEKIRGKFAPAVEDAFLKTCAQLANNPELRNAYINAIIGIIEGGDPEKINSAFMSSFANAEDAMKQYALMLDAAGNAKVDSSVDALNALANTIGYVNQTLIEGKAPLEGYYDAMNLMSELMKGGLDWNDYDAKVQSLIPIMAELTGQTEQFVFEQIKAAEAMDDTGGYIIQQTEGLQALADMAYTTSQQTVDGKRAELEAYAQTMLTVADAIEAAADEAEAKGETSVDIIGAMQGVSDATAELEAQESDTGQEAIAMWKRVGSDINAAPLKGATAAFRDLQKYMHNVDSVGAARKLANDIRQLGQNALTAARQLQSPAKAASQLGKSAGKAAKETDKLKDALKDLKDALEDAKDAAESYIDSVLDFIDTTRKKEEDKLKAERNLLKIQLQEWKNYIDGRQELAQEELELQGKAADMYFNQEIAAIQAKIDALDDEAEAEDRLLKLQKARDDYNKAQNSRTRLVLTKGAGWIFKTDQNEVTNARKALNDVQREIQKANYQKQLDDLQAQATAWQEIAEKIGESAAEAEKLADALKNFTDAVGQEGEYADIDAYTAAVEAQQDANDKYAELSAEVDKWLEQADWEYQDILDSEMARRFAEQFENGTVGRDDLAAKVGNIDEIVAAFGKDFDDYWSIDTKLQEEGLSALQNIAESYHLLKNLEDVETFYNTQKAQLGFTKEQLKVAEEIRDAIQRAYDPTAENLGLGENSKYYNATILDLIQQVQDYAEQIAALEAQQAQQPASGGSSGSGSSGGGSSGGSSGGNIYVPTPSTNSNSNQLGVQLNKKLTETSAGANGVALLNRLRDEGAGINPVIASITVPVNPGNTSTAYSTNTYNISVNTSANTIAALVQDIQRNTSIRKTTTYGTR